MDGDGRRNVSGWCNQNSIIIMTAGNPPRVEVNMGNV